MKKAIITLLMSAMALSTFAGISGPTIVFVGNSYYYTYYGHAIAQPAWTANGGTII